MLRKPLAQLALSLACTLGAGLAHALDISGSSTIQPIVDKLIAPYTAQGGEAIQLSGGGSGKGMKDALAGVSHIGMASRPLSTDEKAALKYQTIGIDALAIIVHQSNPITGLTKAQLADVYSGKVDNWQMLGGPDLQVVRISKEVGRSTLELFEHYTGLVSPERAKNDGKPLISKQSYIIGANNESLTLVGGMPGAIGYVSFGSAEALKAAGMPIKILPLDGVLASQQTILGRTYPIVRELNLAWATDSPAIEAFMALVSSPTGQSAIAALGFVNLPKP